MASDEARKKWGTIFMGEREASVEQLDAMQEPLRRDKIRQEQTEDYMERVRKRAADRAREILGAAYTERLKVLDEARADAEASKRNAARECQKLKGEGEALKKEAVEELEKARRIREEAEQIRAAAREEGLRDGMDQAAGEMREFRAELGQALARVLQSLGAQRKNLVDSWRDDLCELTQAAAAAGAGYLLQKEHKAILNSLVIQALHQLENRTTITVKVNPEDESTVVDMFQAARECVPDIRQWIVTPDDNIEPGGFVAESGAGRVDCRRENFREMVDNILAHLTLPILESEEESARAMQDIVDEEAERLASMAPETVEVVDVEPVEEPAANPEELAANAADAAISENAEIPEDLAAPENAANIEDAANPVDEANLEDAPLADEPAGPASAGPEISGDASEALVGYSPVDVPDEDEEEPEAPGDNQPDVEAAPEDEAAVLPGAQQPTLAELEDELFTSLEGSTDAEEGEKNREAGS